MKQCQMAFFFSLVIFLSKHYFQLLVTTGCGSLFTRLQHSVDLDDEKGLQFQTDFRT